MSYKSANGIDLIDSFFSDTSLILLRGKLYSVRA